MTDTLTISRYGSPDVRIERSGRRLTLVHAPPGSWWDLPATWKECGATVAGFTGVWSEEDTARAVFDIGARKAEEEAMSDARFRVRVVRHG